MVLLHARRRGDIAMKNYAGHYFWWPQIDKPFKKAAHSFIACQSTCAGPV